MLREFPFYDELNIAKSSKAFKEHVRSYSIETIDSEDPSVQLPISKANIENLFKNFLNEIVTLKVLLREYKENTNRGFATVYFNPTIEAVIDLTYGLEKAFQEDFIRIDNWISKGSG